MNAGTFAAVFAALYAGHMVGDHIVQTDAQAAGKTAETGWWRPMYGHLASYLICQILALAAVLLLSGVRLPGLWIDAGLLFSGVTHGFIDRRWPVRWLLRHTGSARFAEMDGQPLNGMYLADQSLHIAALFISALIIAGGAS